jgi:DNA recombination protein RmuC
MIAALIVLQLITLVPLVALWMRKPAAVNEAVDPRLAQLLAADLPTQFTRLDARSEALDGHLRGESSALRSEVLQNISALGETLRTTLDAFSSRSSAQANESREALHLRLNELRSAQTEHLDKLRTAVEARLDALNVANAAKLEEMRKTVDEKLESTLHTRLTQSFGEVQKSLGEVQTGLGEMKGLAVGVGDLKKVLSNVKSRGIVGEFFLGQQLEQMFAPDQYIANARIKSNTLESVEYALKVPNGPDSTLLLALDSKFPIGDWERLEEAYENGSDEDRKRAGSAFERAIRAQAKLICEKYIDPLTTLPFAIMYLPTAGLYAEVMRRPGLHAEIQSQYKVVIAGPSDFSMILTSFQMVFRTLKFQKNLNEIWKVFQIAQSEFEKFGGLMEKVEKQVGTVQTTLKEIGGKSKTVSRAFRNASKLDLGTPTTTTSNATALDNLLPTAVPGAFDGMLPMLVASEEDESA